MMQNTSVEIEAAINRLTADDEAHKVEIGLLERLFKSYYNNNNNSSSTELNVFLEFILVHLINNFNEKSSREVCKLLFEAPQAGKQPPLACNQVLGLYFQNVKKYSDKLNERFANRVLIKLNQVVAAADLHYEIEQYKILQNNEPYVYLNKLDCLKTAMFQDNDHECEYRFRLIVYRRKSLLKIPIKQAYFTLSRNEALLRQFSLNLQDYAIDAAAPSDGDAVNLVVFRFSPFLDLLNNFKISQMSAVLNQVMQLVDQQQVETMLNYEPEGQLDRSNDLIVNLSEVKVHLNDGLYYLDVKFNEYSCQSSVLVTNRAAILHIRDMSFDFLIEKPPLCITLSVYKYATVIELVSQTNYKLNLLEFINTSNSLLLNNKFLALTLHFRLNKSLKLNHELLSCEQNTPEVLDNCLKVLKKEPTKFLQVNLKKVFILVTELHQNKSLTNNQQQKDQLFKILISILSTAGDTCDLLNNKDGYEPSTAILICKYLLQNLKCAFESIELLTDHERQQQVDFLRSFHLVIRLILTLVPQANSENFKLSLKYDLNFIFMKISKKDFNTKFFIYSFLNFKFLSSLFSSNFYTNNEIYEIICSKLFNDTAASAANAASEEFNSYLKLIEEIVLEKLLNSTEFALVLTRNYEFRTKFVSFVVNNFLVNCNKIDMTKLRIIFYLINDLNYKFDKKEFKSVFKVVLSTFELTYKCNETEHCVVKSCSSSTNEHHFDEELFDFKLFLCLNDLITQSVSITAIQQLNNYFDNLKLTDFVHVFHLFSYFLSNKHRYMFKLVWLHVLDVLSQYLALIFKYLLRVIAILTIECTNQSEIEHEIEMMFIAYFQLEFSLNQGAVLSDLSTINNLFGKYKHLNEFLIKNSVSLLLNEEISECDFTKIIDYLINCNQTNKHLLDILVIYEVLENERDFRLKNETQPLSGLLELCADYKQAVNSATKIEQKILAFKLYELIAQIKLTELINFPDRVFKIKFEIEYRLIKNLIKLNEANYYEIIVLYKNKLDVLNKCLMNTDEKVIKIDEIEKFYHLNLFKYLCMYELSTVTKQSDQQQDINLIKIHNKSIYNQLFQIYKHIYKYFIKNPNNYKLIEYINLKLNELNSKLNNTDVTMKLVDEKMLFRNTYYYFCVGFFGSSEASLLRKSTLNRYYLYTSKTNELLTVIQGQVLENFGESMRSNIQLLSLNQDPVEAAASSSSGSLCVQIFALKRLQEDDLVKLLDETLENEDQLNEHKTKITDNHENNVKYFYYDKPFFKNFDNNIENLWIERTIMYMNDKHTSSSPQFQDFIEYFNEFIEIKCFSKIFLQPVQNAVNDCTEKTAELREFINNFTVNTLNGANQSDTDIISKLQPLTMRLLGCLDARVNGGIRLYIKTFLNQAYVNDTTKSTTTTTAKKRKYFCYQLYLSIKNQLNVLESGLTIHNRIIKQLFQQNTSTTTSTDENLNNNTKSINHENETTTTATTNTDHMRQLNKHLISCLNLLKNELDEFL